MLLPLQLNLSATGEILLAAALSTSGVLSADLSTDITLQASLSGSAQIGASLVVTAEAIPTGVLVLAARARVAPLAAVLTRVRLSSPVRVGSLTRSV